MIKTRKLDFGGFCGASALLMAVVYIFFWEYKFVFQSWVWILIITMLSLLSLLMASHNVRSVSIVFLVIFFFFNLVGIFVSNAEITDSIRWCISVLCAVCLMSMLVCRGFNYSFLGKVVLALSAFFVVGIYLDLLFPSFVLRFNTLFLKGSSLESYNKLTFYHYYCGFSGYTAVSGFFSGVASVGFVSVSLSEKKWKRAFFFILGLICLAAAVLTQKRSIVIAAPMSIVFIVLLKAGFDRKIGAFVRIALLLVVLSFVMLMVLTKTDSGKLMLERFFEGDDISSGRFTIIETLVHDWQEYLFFGNGPASVRSSLGVDAHNIYIQTFYENGIFGLISISIYFLINFVFGLKACRVFSKDDNRLERVLLSSVGVQVLFLVYGFFGNCLTDLFFFLLYVVFASIPFCLLLEKTKNRCTNRKRIGYVNGTYRKKYTGVI